MNEVKYACVAGGYSFQMKDDDRVEVWLNPETDEYPESYIFVRKGSVDSEKKFQMEVMGYCCDKGLY